MGASCTSGGGSAAHVGLDPELALADVFADSMVVQRDRAFRVFGRARPGSAVVAQFGGASAKARATRDGRWTLELPAQTASILGRPLRVSASLGAREERVVLRDVVVGDVWICAGQSNMRWRVRQSPREAADVLARARDARLRFFDAESRLVPTSRRYPLEFLKAYSAQTAFSTERGWKVASSETLAEFSGVAYHFAKRLVDARAEVPVGVVLVAVGGAPMEAFLPRDVARDARLASYLDAWWSDARYPAWCKQRVRENLAAQLESSAESEAQLRHPFAPHFVFDASLARWTQMGIRGFAWYQGESNATDTADGPPRDCELNRLVFRSLIDAWRRAFARPDAPFVFVQLPRIARRWAPFREVQERVARETPDVGMAPAIDLGEIDDVHPRAKREIGERMAAWVLAHEEARAKSGRAGEGRPPFCLAPRSLRHTRRGQSLVLEVESESPLVTRAAERARGFEIAGEDRVFHPAHALVRGRTIEVFAPRVRAPRALRYAFEGAPEANVVDEQGRPLLPFRSDAWGARVERRDGFESFEGSPAGPLRTLDSALGGWTAAAGHAEINKRFAHDGRRSLRIFGGARRTVELELSSDRRREGGILSFRAERWTRRSPFRFRVEARVPGAATWRELYRGDERVEVGARFRTVVQCAVPAGSAALRFVATSPSEPRGTAGILIDAMRFEAPEDMRILRVAHEAWVAPALRGGGFCPLTQVAIVTHGTRSPKRVTALRVRVETRGQRGALEALQVYATSSARFGRATPLGEAVALGEELTKELTLRVPGGFSLTSPWNTLWFAGRARDAASWRDRVRVRVLEVQIDGVRHAVGADPVEQRIGVQVRAAGQDGCHTHRIPGLVKTTRGTLLAVYDKRYRSSRDLPGDIDVAVSRSTDGGRIWQAPRTVLDMGKDPEWSFDGVGDPAILVDRTRGRVWVAGTWSHGERSWRGSGPGLEPEETGQLLLTWSDDDGVTWSKPRNITKEIKDPAWRFVLQGPGAGLTTRDGCLVFAAQYRASNASPARGRPFSTVLWSTDGGQRWQIGTGVKVDTTEAQVVELADGSWMLNCRDNRRGARSVFTTRDRGRTWTEHVTSRRALSEPVCMASLMRAPGPSVEGLVFSNPASRTARHRRTLRFSADGGRSWPSEQWLRYDDRFCYGYSCLAPVDDASIGVLYEDRGGLAFLRFNLRSRPTPEEAPHRRHRSRRRSQRRH